MNFIDRKFKQLMEQVDIDEKLRDRKGLSKKPFRWKEFVKLDRIEDVRNYAMNALNLIGEGSSREVYILSSRYVLKIAKNKAGKAQNFYEYQLSQDPKIAPILTRIHDAHPESLWIVSDLVRPFQDNLAGEKDFFKVAGFDFYSMFDDGKDDLQSSIQRVLDDVEFSKNQLAFLKKEVEKARKLGDTEQIRRVERKMSYKLGRIFNLENIAKTLKAKQDGFVKNPNLRRYKEALKYAFEQHDLSDGGDTMNLAHWGKTPDGRAVFLDYGLSEYIYYEFYD